MRRGAWAAVTVRGTWLSLFLLLVGPRCGLAQGYTPQPMQVAGTFATSCGEAVAGDLATGVSLLFLLEPGEARLAFERAEAAEPDCAMASWGIALASLDLPAAVVAPDAQERARRALARARAARVTSEREAAYVEAASQLAEPADTSYATRLRAFANAARGLVRRYPNDAAPALLVALACLAQSTAPADMGQREAATAIALRFGDAPRDPGAAALLVAARDNDADAGTARAAAEVLLQARPPAPRALQAAARIFHRLGAWEAASAAGSAAMDAGGGPDGEWLLRDGRWSDHPLSWLVIADTSAGRFERARVRLADATTRANAAGPALGPLMSWRVRAILELAWFRFRWARVDWSAPIAWPDLEAEMFPPTSEPPRAFGASEHDDDLYAEVVAERACVEGLIAARSAWPRGEPDRLAAARGAADRLDALAADHPVPPRFELMATQVRLAISAALEARDELAILEAHATTLQRRVEEAGVPVPLVVDAVQLAGDAHLQLRDWREASWLFRALTAQRPAQARAWLGAARAAKRLGDASAPAMARRFLDIWSPLDSDRPEQVEALQIAGGH